MLDMKKPVIAIDGPAASGKGTVARKIAETLNFAYMDTGKLYRAVGVEVLKKRKNPEDEASAFDAAREIKDMVLAAEKPSDVLGDPELSNDEAGQAASKVAAIDIVRKVLLELQQSFAENPPEGYAGAVLDGRDIGTVICPDADAKLFVTASSEIRAERRTKELQSCGLDATYEAVLKDMLERDARDAERSVAPLKPADDAETLDTSDLTQEQVLDKALEIIRKNMPV